MKIGYAMIKNSTDPIEHQIEILKEKGCVIIYKEIISEQNSGLFSLRELLEDINTGYTICMQNLTLIAIDMEAPLGLLDILIEKEGSLEITDKNQTFKHNELSNLRLMWIDLLRCREKIKSRSVKKALTKRRKI